MECKVLLFSNNFVRGVSRIPKHTKATTRSVQKKRCFQKFRKIHRKIPVPKLKPVQEPEEPGLRTATLLKMRPWHRSFPVNSAKFKEHLFYNFLRTPLDYCF